MNIEAWVSIACALVSIGTFVGMTKAQDKRLTRVEDAVDDLKRTCVTKSDFRDLAREVRGHSLHDGE